MIPLVLLLLGALGNPVVSELVPALPVGERLVYEGRVKIGGVWVTAGRATFTVTERDDGTRILSSSARAAKLGYELDARIRTFFRKGSTRPALYHYLQRGSEFREKKLLFRDGGAVYMKLKHCKIEGCTHKKHQVTKTRWVGIIPWGTHRVHCRRSGCDRRKHLIWRERGRHDFETPFVDLLTAVYCARGIDFSEPGRVWVVPVVDDRNRWWVEVAVQRLEKATIALGSFDAAELVLSPRAEEGKVREEFKGLFGLHGAIRIWIDVQSRRPLRVQGKIPFAFLDFDAAVELVEIGTTSPTPKGG